MKNRVLLIGLLISSICIPACSGVSDKTEIAKNETAAATVSSSGTLSPKSGEPSESVLVPVVNQKEALESNSPPETETAKSTPTPAEPTANGISIQYVGNSSFYIVFPDGTRLLTDPYGSRYESSFAPIPDMQADIVTVSHRHADHTGGIYELTGKPQIIYPERLNEPINIGSVTITGYASKHVNKGSSMGDNTVFVYQYDNYRIVNMGETDRIEGEDLLAAAENADVLLMYAGEYGDVKNQDIIDFAEKKGIRVLIPQHFSMDPEALWYDEPSIDMILKEVPQNIPVIDSDQLIVNKDMKSGFVVLKPMGG